MTQLTEKDELSCLAARIRDQLADLCPRSSLETRSIFAMQIALAELRSVHADAGARELGWLNELN